MSKHSPDQPREPLLAPEQFRKTAARFPHTTALVFDESRLTYRGLDHLSNRLARQLMARGSGPETLVAIHLQRSQEVVVALLAIWKAGAAYLPLDPRQPQERMQYMIEDAAVSLIITSSDLVDRFSASAPPRLLLNSEHEAWAEGSPEPLPLAVAPSHRAYVIYTSGSTGRPKGVELHHLGLSHLIAAQAPMFKAAPGSRVLQFSPLSFDAPLFEIVMALMQGATLYLAFQEDLMPGPGLLDLLRKEHISHLTIPPTALAALPHGELPHLKYLACAGEACPKSLVERFAPGRHFFNLYGPTESTVWTTGRRLEEDAEPTIGNAIPGLAVRVMDMKLRPAVNGDGGELCIAGLGVARGYLARPALTAERFVPDAESQTPGGPLYKSGDRVRWKGESDLVFLGRIDRQTKIRGQRIELGEIESVLRSHPGVADCAVLAREETTGRRLVA